MSQSQSQSQVESMLKKLQSVLAESGSPVKTEVKQESPVDSRAASQALKDFLGKNSSLVKGEAQAAEDPKLVIERRKAVSTFIGAALTNNGVAVLPGTISQENRAHAKPSSHGGHKDSHGKPSHAQKAPEPVEKTPLPPVAPAPTIVMTVCPSCVQAEAVAKSAAADKAAGIEPEKAAEKTAPEAAKPVMEQKPALETKAPNAANNNGSGSTAAQEKPTSSSVAAPVNTPKPSSMDMGMSFGSSYSFSKPVTQSESSAQKTPEPAARPAPEPAAKASPEPAAKPKNVVASLFSAFGGKKNDAVEATSASAALAAEPASKSAASQAPGQAAIIWFKHFQSVESALRIGDAHFADSVVSVLHEAAVTVSAEQNIMARIESLRARILMDRKQHSVAEKTLTDSINSLKGTKWETNVATAYCWHALGAFVKCGVLNSV